MPPKSPKIARRAGLPPRSKAGCLTCKAKHLKCDETRPACLRCSQKGLQCGGYWQGVRWSFKHQPDLAAQTFQPQEFSYLPASELQKSGSGSGLGKSPPGRAASRPAAKRAHQQKQQQQQQQQQQSQQQLPQQRLPASRVDDYPDLYPDGSGFTFSFASSSASSPSHIRPQSRASESEASIDRRRSTQSRMAMTSLVSHSLPGTSALGGATVLAHNQAQPPSASPIPGLVDKSSAFIMNWFENVCPAWSGFDSDANPIRRLAVDLWSSSVTVSSSLESMSAAFLASRNPNMRQPALRLMKKATDYMQMELQIVKSQQPLPQAIPAGLLFSLFGLGTTICWVDPRGLGLPFFREARLLLARLNSQWPARPGSTDANMLDFFNKCMTYCNMLLAVVVDDEGLGNESSGVGGGGLRGGSNNSHGSGSPSGDDLLSGFLASSQWSSTGRGGPPLPALPPSMDSLPGSARVASGKAPATSKDHHLHPWTGVSSLTSHLFTETVRLCRRCRHRDMGRFNMNDMSGMSGMPLNDLGIFFPLEDLQAERLEEQLLDMEISPDGGPSDDTGDCTTPASHLALVAEAYRLASLLLLYQTFPHLGFLRLPGRTLLVNDKSVLWQEWITPLSLHLLGILERIPPTSGSRVIQPLLYISASTGLRLPTGVCPPGAAGVSGAVGTGSSVTEGGANVIMPAISGFPFNLDLPPFGDGGYSGSGFGLGPVISSNPPDNLSSYISDLMGGDSSGPSSPINSGADAGTSDSALDVARARQFIMQRLTILESSLPPTPVTVAKELVATIWRAYDSCPPGAFVVHWIDVMEANDLRSMFG